MTPPGPPSRDAARFGALFEAHQRDVLAYARRRTTSIADAEDAAAETFVIVWRRIATVPIEPLPWLYGVARRVLANQRRGQDRRLRLAWRVRDDVPTPAFLGEDTEAPAMVALTRLRADDQELLRLVAWEELGNSQIAEVLGATPNAIAIRLHRARGRFSLALADVLRERGVKDPAASRTHEQVKGTASRGAGTEGP
jgi:RNA polymerase sigma-70 factor (ECF subfamily)